MPQVCICKGVNRVLGWVVSGARTQCTASCPKPAVSPLLSRLQQRGCYSRKRWPHGSMPSTASIMLQLKARMRCVCEGGEVGEREWHDRTGYVVRTGAVHGWEKGGGTLDL